MGHTVYVGLGYVFMDSVAFVAEITGDMLGLVVALVVAISAALWSRAAIKAAAPAGGAAASIPWGLTPASLSR